MAPVPRGCGVDLAPALSASLLGFVTSYNSFEYLLSGSVGSYRETGLTDVENVDISTPGNRLNPVIVASYNPQP